MHEIDLGTIDAHASELGELLGDSDPRLRQGRFHVVGRRDERGGVRTGALVRHVGNDQWSVYLLNEQQLEKVAQRRLEELGRESGTGRAGSGVATEAGVTLAAHALGPVGTAVAPILEVASIAGSALGLGGESSATKIARRLAADGVAPGDVARVTQEVRASTPDANPSTDDARARTSEIDGERRSDDGGARAAVSIDRPTEAGASRDGTGSRKSPNAVAADVALGHDTSSVEPTSEPIGSDGRADRNDAATGTGAPVSDRPPVAVDSGRAGYAAPASKPRSPARTVDALGLER